MTKKVIWLSSYFLNWPALNCARFPLQDARAFTLRRNNPQTYSTRDSFITQWFGVRTYIFVAVFCFVTSLILSAVSLSLKVRSRRGAVTRSTPKQWKDHLTSRSHLITLNQAQIDGLKIGVKFGKAIELPSDLRLNADLMCDMLVPRDPSTVTVRYFTHLTWVHA